MNIILNVYILTKNKMSKYVPTKEQELTKEELAKTRNQIYLSWSFYQDVPVKVLIWISLLLSALAWWIMFLLKHFIS